MFKIKWKVSDVPTGRYRSFTHRSWPMAFYNDVNGEVCAQILCGDDYEPRNIKTGNHEWLTLWVADHSKTPWEYVAIKQKFKTLAELKTALPRVLDKYPHFVP